MKDFCQFLKLEQSELRCMASINFASVGPGRALCRACPLADLGDVALCKHADVYTTLRRDNVDTTLIEVRICCSCGDNAIIDAERCVRCSARLGIVTSEATSWFIPVPE